METTTEQLIAQTSDKIKNLDAQLATATKQDAAGSIPLPPPPKPRPIKDALFRAVREIVETTNATVRVADMTLTMNPNTAHRLASTSEVSDDLYVSILIRRGGPFEIDKGYGLPPDLYGVKVKIEEMVIRRSADSEHEFIFPDNQALLEGGPASVLITNLFEEAKAAA